MTLACIVWLRLPVLPHNICQLATFQGFFAGKSSSHPPKTSSQTSLLSSSSEQSMDCNLHLLPIKSDVATTRNQDGGGDGEGSNSNMSTGSDYSPAPTVLANDSNDKLGKIKVKNGKKKNTGVGLDKFSFKCLALGVIVNHQGLLILIWSWRAVAVWSLFLSVDV